MSNLHTSSPQAALNLCTPSQKDGLVPGDVVEQAVKVFRMERWYNPKRVAEQVARETPGVPDYPSALSQHNALTVMWRSNATAKPSRDSVWEPQLDEEKRHEACDGVGGLVRSGWRV